ARRNPGPDVDGDPAQLVADHLTLSRVETRAHLQPELSDGLVDRARAADRARRPVEAGEESVSGSIELTPAEAVELPTHERVVRCDQLRPRRSPTSAAFCVEATMSVKSTVSGLPRP